MSDDLENLSKADEPGQDAAPAVQRPPTVVLAVVGLIASSLLALIAASTLFGLHSYLVHSARKSNPKPILTTAQVTQEGQQVGTFLSGQLTVGGPLSKAQIDAVANATQKYLVSQLPTRNLTSSQIKDQGSQVHDDVVNRLSAQPTAPVTATQISAVSGSVQKSVTDSLTKVKKDQKKPLTEKQIQDQAHKTPITQLIANLLIGAIFCFLAFKAWRGWHQTRWAVLIIWVLGSFTGSLAGLGSIFTLFASAPNVFKIPAGLAGLTSLAAVVGAMLPASVAYFAAHRPAGAPQRRGGLFAPRPPRTPAGGPAGGGRGAGGSGGVRAGAKTALNSSAATRGDAYVERQRAKKRSNANADSVRIGAELARSRAKASKSRRTES